MNQDPTVEPIEARCFDALVAVLEETGYPAEGSYACQVTWRKGRMVVSLGGHIEQSQPDEQGAGNGR